MSEQPVVAGSVEADIIARLQAGALAGEGVVVGIGDDAAVTRLPPDCELLTATDALVEGTHFAAGAPPQSVGHRALAVNLSDIAAMGGRPLWASLALSVPEHDPAWTDAFATGFSELAALHGVALIGGDTVRGPRSAVVTVQGAVAQGGAVLRSTAREGDLLCVTGTPGDAVGGRFLLEGRLDSVAGEADYLRGRFQYPQPRVIAGQRLRPLVTAMLDVSDGLDTDLRRLLAASGKGARPDVSALPCSTPLLNACGLRQAQACALLGGEDYELAFTAAVADMESVAVVARELELRITVLAEVTGDTDLVWMDGAQPYVMPAGRYEHFA
ncbi:MAG: thiamine-phosphate kinase [Gammaproteobacteria bacterium]|jgi:thiamine-monophosphate kinase|nr:thiamine-phosphate kinase [Gammaproteobacteria bacterium]